LVAKKIKWRKKKGRGFVYGPEYLREERTPKGGRANGKRGATEYEVIMTIT